MELCLVEGLISASGAGHVHAPVWTHAYDGRDCQLAPTLHLFVPLAMLMQV